MKENHIFKKIITYTIVIIYNDIIFIMKVVQKNIKHIDLFSHFEIDSLKLGETVVFDIFIKRRDDYIIIIEAGTVITQNLYEKLKKQDKLYISSLDRTKQELTCESLIYYVKHNINDLKKTLNYLYEINTKLFTKFLDSKENKIDVNCVTSLVKSIILLIKTNPDYLKNTITHFLNDSKLELAIHSLHVCIFSINLGNALKLENERLIQLGTASLLHDVGIKRIDNTIMSKESVLSSSEIKSVHQHSQYSVEIIKHNHIFDPYVIDAITHHHESYDASGYPDHLYAKNISDLASIISISDVFDALTNDRVYRKAYSSFEAIKIMMKDETMMNKFNRK